MRRLVIAEWQSTPLPNKEGWYFLWDERNEKPTPIRVLNFGARDFVAGASEDLLEEYDEGDGDDVAYIRSTILNLPESLEDHLEWYVIFLGDESGEPFEFDTIHTKWWCQLPHYGEFPINSPEEGDQARFMIQEPNSLRFTDPQVFANFMAFLAEAKAVVRPADNLSAPGVGFVVQFPPFRDPQDVITVQIASVDAIPKNLESL